MGMLSARHSSLGFSHVITFAATGSSHLDAAPAAAGCCIITGADNTKGVKLPPLVAPADGFVKVGALHFIYNQSASALKVYPPLGGSLGGGAANAAILMNGNTMKLFVALNAASGAWAAL